MTWSLRVAYGVVVFVLAVLFFVWMSMICSSVYGFSECIGFVNRAVFGLAEDENEQ